MQEALRFALCGARAWVWQEGSKATSSKRQVGVDEGTALRSGLHVSSAETKKRLLAESRFGMARRFLVLYAVAVALLLVCAQAAGARPLVEAAEGGLVRGPRATSHQHWEHLVRRSVSRWDSGPDEYDDETADIADVRDYYRRVFADPEGWEDVREQREEMLVRLMEQLQREKAEHRTGNARANAHGYPPPWGRARVSSQEAYTKPAKDWSSEAEAIGCLRKPIRGRYIVMFQADTSDYVLDRTIEILERANLESERRFRATDITPIRHLRKGFVATMNARTLHLVREIGGRV